MSKEMNMCKLGKIHPNRVEWFLELPKTFIFFSQKLLLHNKKYLLLTHTAFE